LEHDGRRPFALWVFNDTPNDHAGAVAICRVYDGENRLRFEARNPITIQANRSQRVGAADWPVPAAECDRVELDILDRDGAELARNGYRQPFRPASRPRGYPWKFDPFLGCKVFDLPGAPSLADQSRNPLLRLVPLAVREGVAEWVLRQRVPPQVLSVVATLVDQLNR
jgi:hypothetical protein